MTDYKKGCCLVYKIVQAISTKLMVDLYYMEGGKLIWKSII